MTPISTTPKMSAPHEIDILSPDIRRSYTCCVTHMVESWRWWFGRGRGWRPAESIVVVRESLVDVSH